MRLLLDTHFLLTVVGEADIPFPKGLPAPLTGTEWADVHVSTASLWEIAIKVRARKLELSESLTELPRVCEAFKLIILPILPRHVLAPVEPEPRTRDPFDRLLLAQAACEGCRLVTVDGALAGHPMVWRPT